MSETREAHNGAPEDLEVEVVQDQAAPQTPDGSDSQQNQERKRFFDTLEDGDEAYGHAVQKRIDKEVRRRKEIAEEARREREARMIAEQQLAELRKQAFTANEEATSRDLESAKERYKRAFAEGDAETASAALAEVSELSARRVAIQAQSRAQTAQPAASPQNGLSEKTRAFIAENAWFNDDPEARDLALTAHNAALRRGLAVDSPEYFDLIRNRVRAVFPHHFQQADEPEDDEMEQPKPTRSVAPVAPAQRSVPGAAPTNKPKLERLTAEQAAMAKRMGLTYEQYAASLVALRKQGKI